jgi:PucR family transcriptional regulator, purine catabolism regulatory protein
VHHDLARQLRALMGARGLVGLAAVVGDRVASVIGCPDDDAAGKVEVTCRGALSAVLEVHPEVIVQMGVSRRVGPEALRTGLSQASEAAAHGARTAGGSGVCRYEQLGLLHLLGQVRGGPALSRYVEDELGPLLDHDAAGRTPLVDTLRAYLDAGAHKANAARALHLERRSLYYRISRIEQLLGRSLNDPATRLRLGVALHALDLLQQRPGHSEED